MPIMKERIEPVEDDFWTERRALFPAQFPTYYTKPEKAWGRLHTSEEQYESSRHEIIPISEKKGPRTYVMMQPYVREPKLTLTVGLYTNPKYYADQDSPIDAVIGANQEGFREAQVGNAQAWYYHADKTIVLWECFFDERFRKHPLPENTNMQKLWQSFEHYPGFSVLCFPLGFMQVSAHSSLKIIMSQIFTHRARELHTRIRHSGPNWGMVSFVTPIADTRHEGRHQVPNHTSRQKARQCPQTTSYEC
jgi:hypothetical protein